MRHSDGRCEKAAASDSAITVDDESGRIENMTEAHKQKKYKQRGEYEKQNRPDGGDAFACLQS